MNPTPPISIIIPVYNGSDYVKEAIESALAQTYVNFEVIVVNDGSNDGGATDAVVRSFGDKVRYISKENGGVASALNRGITEAKGEYISWLSHDDAYEKDKLDLQMRFLEGLPAPNRQKTIVYANTSWMDERSQVYDRSDLPEVPPEKFYQALLGGRIINGLLDQRIFFMNGCTALFPRKALVEAGLFDEKLRTTQDYDMWFKLCGSYDFVLLNYQVLRSRIHKGQGTYILRGSMAEEVGKLYLKAFMLYSPGSPRYDLDLARTALALRMDPRRHEVFWAVWKKALHGGNGPRGLGYLFTALLWNRYFARMKIAYNSFRRRRKQRSGADSA